MPTLEEKAAELISGLRDFSRQDDGTTGCMLGQVTAIGADTLQVACNGLVLGREDLWVASHLSWEDDGEPNTLRVGDRVVCFTPDGDSYYIMSKVVRA